MGASSLALRRDSRSLEKQSQNARPFYYASNARAGDHGHFWLPNRARSEQIRIRRLHNRGESTNVTEFADGLRSWYGSQCDWRAHLESSRPAQWIDPCKPSIANLPR